MTIHAIVPVSRVNGPGERFVIWTQGCGRACPGCFNPAARILPSNFFSRAHRNFRAESAKIPTGLSGGSAAASRRPSRFCSETKSPAPPIPCAPKGRHFDFTGPAELSIEEIVSYIPRGKVSGITVSGGEPFLQPEELARLLAAARSLGLHTLVYSGFTYKELRRLFPDCLRETDILIDGPYMKDVPRTDAWAGSGNQKIHYLIDGKSVPRDAVFSGGLPEGEILIDKTGRVTVTGGFRLDL